MPLSLDEVRRHSGVGPNRISDAETRPSGQLNDILELIGRMQKVDTEGVEPMSHAHGSRCVCARIK